MHSDRAPFFLKLAAWGGVVFLHFPILIIAAMRLTLKMRRLVFHRKA